MRICQLINLSLVLFLSACASHVVDDSRDQRVITPGWLKIPARFSLRDKDDNYLTHPFFDVSTSFNKDKRTIRFFVTTPEESEFKYGFDLYSGRLYGEHDYCPSDDVWDAYTGEVQRPNFTQGIVPRMYDQNGNPQRIIVFGMPKGMDKTKYHPQYFENAKIVGSIIIDACDSYPCDLKSKWKAAQILVAVNPQNPEYTKVNFLNELRSKTNWIYVKAILNNQDGVYQVGQKFFPAFRISKELSLDDSFRYMESNSKIVDMAELSKWREGCFKLYDDIWEKSEKIRAEKRDQQDLFLKFFKDFYAKNSNQFYACGKLVRPANINEDPRRLWFFAYLQAFANLEKNSFYYSCSSKAWSYNPKVDDEHYYNNQNRELERCRARDFEKSFDQAINGLSLMRGQTNKEYRFFEYDSGRGGSHQKIYGWINVEGKSLICKNKKGLFQFTKPEQQENTFDVFPQDVVWQNFTADEDKTVK